MYEVSTSILQGLDTASGTVLQKCYRICGLNPELIYL